MVAALMVAAHGLHHFVNGWCNYHWQWQPSLLRVGCTCCCPIIEISLQSPPLTFMWGNCSLASSAQACFFSTSLQLAALPSLQVLATPFNHQSHQSTPFLTQKDHFNQMVCHITSEECYRLSLGQHSPSSVSTRLGPEWLSSLTSRLTTPLQMEISISKCDSNYLSISIWSRAHHSSKSLLIPELRLPSVPP
jgi:hypothetical protein